MDYHKFHDKIIGRFSSSDEYKCLEDYQSELESVNQELEDIDNTIKYYVNKKHILTDWKYSLEMSIGKWDDSDTCGNCKFFKDLYCVKFKSSVDREATCSSFEWCEEEYYE